MQVLGFRPCAKGCRCTYVLVFFLLFFFGGAKRVLSFSYVHKPVLCVCSRAFVCVCVCMFTFYMCACSTAANVACTQRPGVIVTETGWESACAFGGGERARVCSVKINKEGGRSPPSIRFGGFVSCLKVLEALQTFTRPIFERLAFIQVCLVFSFGFGSFGV